MCFRDQQSSHIYQERHFHHFHHAKDNSANRGFVMQGAPLSGWRRAVLPCWPLSWLLSLAFLLDAGAGLRVRTGVRLFAIYNWYILEMRGKSTL